MQPAAVLAVIVKAQGVTGTNAQLATVQKTAEKVDSKVTRMGDSMVASGKKIQSAGRTMTVGLTLPLVGAGYLAIKTAATFERSMAQVKVAGEVGGGGIKELEQLALQMGAKTVFSANDASEAMLELVKSGITPTEVKAGALASTMSLAATESMALGHTAEIVGAAMNTFNLKADESQRIADALAGGAIASAASVEGLAMSLSQGGQSAAMYGLSIEETVGALAAFAQNGIQASDAGTSFKTFMMRLNPVQKKQKELMNELNLTFFNQSGELVNLTEVSGRLREALGGMSQQQRNAALQTLFGSDAQRAANIVFKEGPKGLKEYIMATKKRGTAEKMANAQMKGMPGAIERMKGSLETAALVAGKAMAPAVEDVAKVIEGLANAFSELDPEMQTTIIVALAVVAALGPMVYVMGALIKNGGYVVKAIGWVITSLSAETVATEAATVANAEFAASLQAAAMAQRELLIANSSGVVTGSMPITGAAPIAPAGASSAKSFAGGFAKMLPMALAAVGVGNILSSVMGGDTRGAAFKTGGSIAGAIAGGLVGGLPGALVGAGIGSLLGGELGKLFDAKKAIAPLDEAIAEQSQKVAHSTDAQRSAFQNLTSATERQSSAGHRVRRSTKALHEAEASLSRARHKYPADADPIIRKEIQVREKRQGVTRATQNLKNAERGTATERKIAYRLAKVAIADDKEQLSLLNHKRKELLQNASAALKNGRSNKVLSDIQKGLQRNQEKLDKTQGNYNKTLSEVATKVGPKAAKGLEQATILQLRSVGKLASKAKVAVEVFKRIESGQKISASTARHWAEVFGHSGTKAKDGVEKVKKSMGPFQRETSTQMGKAGKDVSGFSKTTVTGVEDIESILGAFAGKLGIKGVHFGAKKGKEAQKKQTGGMVVPGGGTGDKVPLTAMVEPGEIVHVLNSRASKDREKLAMLEGFNREVPRFAKGGALGVQHSYPGLSGDTDFYPEMGFALSKMAHGTGNAISVASGYRSVAEQAALYQLYLEGKGNLAAAPSPNAPHVKGYAADIAPDRGTFGGVAGNYGLGFTVPSEAWHIELLNAAAGAAGKFSGSVPKMPHMEITGPSGALLETGQGVFDAATKMAQGYLNKHAGAMGVTGNVPNGPVIQMAEQMVANIWGAGQFPPFNLLEMSEAGWDPEAVNPSSGAGGLAQALPPSKYPPGAWPYAGPQSAKLQLEWMMGYIKERYGTPAGAWAFHQANNWYQKGGVIANHLGSLQKGTKGKGEGDPKQKSPFDKPLKTVAGKHIRKGQGMVRKLNRKLEGMGFDPDSPVIKRLSDLTTDVEKYDEFASNASALNTEEENPATGESETIQGLFKGRNEGEWLSEKLGSLMNLRKQLITSHGVVDRKTGKTTDLLHEAKVRLGKVRKAIAQGERDKRQIEQKIKDLEKARDDKVRQIEAEKKELERKLSAAQGAKNPNHDYIVQLHEEIRSKTYAINHEGEAATEAIKKQHTKLNDVNDKQKSRKRVETALDGTLIPTLEAKRSDLLQTGVDIYGQGGTIGSRNYMGLQTVQGTGSPLEEVPSPPPIGMLGGEIFGVQNRLRELGEEAQKSPLKDPLKEEAEALEKEINLEWKKRYVVSQAQMSVLTDFPSVQQVAAVPYVGERALGGGMVAATVGERGKEIVVAPGGSQVLSNKDAKDAVAQQGSSGPPVFEEVNFYEDGRVTGRAGGEDFSTYAKRVGRRPSTPGGKQ